MIKQFLINHNLIKGKFYIDAFVYIDKETRLPVKMSDTIKNLKSFCIECKIKEVDTRAFEMLHYKYPEFAGYINLY